MNFQLNVITNSVAELSSNFRIMYLQMTSESFMLITEYVLAEIKNPQLRIEYTIH